MSWQGLKLRRYGVSYRGGSLMITIRRPEEIFEAHGDVEDGSFDGRWHFSFGGYHDQRFEHFGALRVFNDDTLSPGAVWPLHPHRDIEVVTYCAAGEFRHADERGKGGVLKKGDVQHTTVGRGIWHSEINNLGDRPMRFIQMWFIPRHSGLKPSVEQKSIAKEERTGRLKLLVSEDGDGALPIASDARVYSSFLEKGAGIGHRIGPGRGVYLYLVEGGPIEVNRRTVDELGAAIVREEPEIEIKARVDSELLLIDVALAVEA